MWESLLWEMISKTRLVKKVGWSFESLSMHSREHIRFLLHEAGWPLKKNVGKGDEKHAHAPIPPPRSQGTEEGKGS